MYAFRLKPCVYEGIIKRTVNMLLAPSISASPLMNRMIIPAPLLDFPFVCDVQMFDPTVCAMDGKKVAL